MVDAGDVAAFIFCVGGLNPLCWGACSSDSESRSIPPLPGPDTGGDAVFGDTVGDSFGVPEVIDGSNLDAVDVPVLDTPETFIGDVQADTVGDNGPVADGSTTVPDIADDPGTIEPPPPQKPKQYTCLVNATDAYGATFGSYLESYEDISHSSNSWTGSMLFQPAEGTNTSKADIDKILNQQAGNWSEGLMGSVPPSSADNLVSAYGVSFSENQGELSIENYDASGNPGGATLIPMTFADKYTGVPQPISSDLSNLVYLSTSPELGEIQVGYINENYDLAGASVYGDAGWSAVSGWDNIMSIEVFCY